MQTTATDTSEMDAASLAREAEAVERHMRRFIDARPLPDNLTNAIKYALLGGGKRLRPILTLRSFAAISDADPLTGDALAPAAAIEMIHCFSLVHDDLPAMDDDDLRRGRPTLHRATSEAMAILAGDALTALAFELIATTLEDPAVVAALCRELAVATNDMIAGQVYDTLPDFADDVEPLERLRTIHRHKTGALIRCACRMGAIVGGADSKQLAEITRYGEAVGLMFQIVDDVLDVTQTTEHLGKTAGKDAEQGKLTYPGLLGLAASRREVERLAEEAYDALRTFGDRSRGLREVCDFFAVRTR